MTEATRNQSPTPASSPARTLAEELRRWLIFAADIRDDVNAFAASPGMKGAAPIARKLRQASGQLNRAVGTFCRVLDQIEGKR